MSRIFLNAPLDLYVSSTGSDANDGLSTSTPKLTLPACYNLVRDGYDTLSKQVTVHVMGALPGASTFSGPIVGQSHPSQFQFSGGNAPDFPITASAPGAICFFGADDAAFEVCGLALSAPYGGFGVVSSGARIWVRDCYYFTTGYSSIDAAGPRSQIVMVGNHVWSHLNTFNTAIVAEDHGEVDITGCLICSGSPTFGTAFAQVDLGGLIDATGATVNPGSASGRAYNALSLGIIHAPPNFFPGSSAGVVSGGYYG